MKASHLWEMVKTTVWAWFNDEAPSMGAALAYYTLFSIAPLLVMVIAVAGLIFGREAAQGHIIEQLRDLTGEGGAVAVQELLKSVSDPAKSGLATLVGVITSLIGATAVFAELHGALNRIWRAPVAPKIGGLQLLLRARILSFGMLLGIEFLLLVSLVLSAVLAAVGKWWSPFFGGWNFLMQMINFIADFTILTLAFAMIYKLLPRAKIGWPDVWIGAAVTALLFTIGKLLMGQYLGRIGTASAFGAAGSLVVLLIWVYYSAQIFLLGAEFTWVYAHRFGSRAGELLGETAPAAPGKTGKDYTSLSEGVPL